jgi:ribonuclease R
LKKQNGPSGADFQKQILSYMADGTYRPLKPKELAQAIDVPQTAYSTFRRLIRDMLGRGDVIRLRHGRLALPGKLDLVRGRIHAHRKGFAFVVLEAGGDDVYIDPDHLKTAMHNDIVLIQKLSTSFRGKPEGRVVRVVKRGHPKVVGTFQKGRHFFFVVPEDERLPRDIYIPPGQELAAKPGQIVVVDLAEWDDPARAPEGRVVEILGFPDDPGVDVLTVIFEHALPLAFPTDVTDEALAISARIPRDEIERRMDCRDLAVVTIDPKDAKDHDDALSVKALGNGLFEVGVHIADVSHYVQPGSGLDREALLRGTSVYLVDRVIPMLPDRLSGDLCSLRAGVDRLALSCFLTLDEEARLKTFRVAETCIRSAGDMTYEQVQQYFDDGKIAAALTHMSGPLDSLLALSQKLTGRRMAAGSLDFDLPEARIELAPDGSVSDIYELVRLPSHRLVEEFMLLANKTVARYLQTTGVPVLYRVHDRPSQEKLDIFSEFVGSLGLKFKASPELQPKHIQKLIEEVRGRPEEGLVNEVLLRSMSKAVYQPENIGHFGLAFDRYVHFTSPIRRYPDLTVHRAVKRKLASSITPAWTKQQNKELTVTGRHASQRERVAMEAERDSVRIKQITFMETQLGEEFTGLLSGIRSFGLFVKLDKILVEGLIPIGTLGDDYYHVDEERFRARGRNTGRRFRLGDAVTVQVVRVDPVSKQVDFKLVAGGNSGPKEVRKKDPVRHGSTRKTKRTKRKVRT